MPYYKTTSIAELYCKKEENHISDESVTPWPNEDLIMMKNSQLIVRSGRGKVICNWRAKLLVPTNVAGEVVLPNMLRMMMADMSLYVCVEEGRRARSLLPILSTNKDTVDGTP